MNCDCLICRKNKIELFDNLIKSGNSFKQILTELQKYNRVTSGVLEKHLVNAGYSNLIPEKVEIKKVSTEQINSFNFNQISFDEYSFDETNPENVIEYFQKALIFMYGRQLQIVAAQQQEKYLGEESTGLIEFIKLEKIEGMLHRIYPIHIYANQRIAMDVVARMGYKLSLSNDVQITSDTKAT